MKVNMQLEFYLATATLFSCKELDFYLAKYRSQKEIEVVEEKIMSEVKGKIKEKGLEMKKKHLSPPGISEIIKDTFKSFNQIECEIDDIKYRVTKRIGKDNGVNLYPDDKYLVKGNSELDKSCQSVLDALNKLNLDLRIAKQRLYIFLNMAL